MAGGVDAAAATASHTELEQLLDTSFISSLAYHGKFGIDQPDRDVFITPSQMCVAALIGLSILAMAQPSLVLGGPIP